MPRSKIFEIAIIIPLIAYVISLILVPYFYNQRLNTNIFRVDIYIIWILGIICWIFNLLFSRILLTRLTVLTFFGSLYVLLLCFLKNFPDENSIYLFITLMSLIGILYYFRLLFRSKYYHVVPYAILCIFFLFVLDGYRQATEHGWESLSIKGWFFNSGFFANYITSIIPLLFARVITKNKFNLLQIIFVIFLILGLVLLAITFARAAYIGVIAGCVTVFVLFIKNGKSKILLRTSLVVIILMPLIMIWLYHLKPSSALGRLTIYKVSINIIKNNPLLGIGPNRFSAVYNNFQSDYFKSEQPPIASQLLAENTFEAFNSIIQVLVEYGLIGLLILILIIYEALINSSIQTRVPTQKWFYIGSFGCIAAILFSSFFSNPFHITEVLLVLLFHLSVVLQPPKQSFHLLEKRWFISLVPIIFFSSLTLYYINSQFKAEMKWHQASELAKYGDFLKASKLYKEAYHSLKYNGDFLFNYGAEAFLANKYNLSAKLLERSKKYSSANNIYIYLGDVYSETNRLNLAEENYLHAIFATPSHIYPKYKLIKLYKKWGRLDLEKHWIKKTLEYPVKIRTSFTDDLIDDLKKEYRFNE